MAGTVFNSTSFGVQLYNQILQNPATIASGATITNQYPGVYNGDAVYGNASAGWTVANYGTVVGTATYSNGVHLTLGGVVDNAAGTSFISGNANGVYITGAAGTVANYGTIEAVGATGSSAGVLMLAGGRVDNGEFGASSALITGYYGVDIRGGAGAVYNDGTIAGIGQYSYGVLLRAGGDVSNGSSGLVTGAYGVAIRGGGTLTNYGTIAGTFGGGAYLTGGAVRNGYLGGSGVLLSGYYGLFSSNALSLTNYGTIVGTATGSYFGSGVYIGDGSTVTNGAPGQAALITGYDGVRIAGVGTVTNYSTISGSGGGGAHGVYLYGGGLVINQSGGLIAAEYAVSIGIGAGTVANFGTIFGDEDAVRLAAAAGAVDNYGTLIGQYGYGAYLQTGGTVTNELGGVITGIIAGVKIDGAAGLVVNSGDIGNGTGGGVYIQAGGTVTNTVSGRIVAYADGIFINGGPGTVTNFGTVEATITGGGGTGIDINSGIVINGTTGAILVASGLAVHLGANGTLANYGTIANADGSAVRLGAGATLVNGAAGAGNALITGYDGVRIYGTSGFLANYGTIASNGTGFGAQGVDLLNGGTLHNFGTILGTNNYASGVNAGGASDLIVNGTLGVGTAAIAGWLNGIDQFSDIGTVVNYGTVTSSHGDGVYLQAGGSIANLGGLISAYRFGINIGNAAGAVTNTGTITGQFGLDLSGGTETVVNSGTVVSTRVLGSSSGGMFLRGGGYVSNTGLVQSSGGLGVYIGNAVGSLANSGTIVSSYSLGYAYFGVYLRAGGNVTNDGVIDGSGGGVAILGGGTVANNATIAGDTGIAIVGAPGLVANIGTISGTYGSAIYLGASGTVGNQGRIGGINDVVLVRIDGLVDNAGTIAASGGTAVWLADGGTLFNTGLLTGTDDVVFTGYTGGTIVNYGTIVDIGSIGAGVCLDAGGFVSNDALGIILGVDIGIEANNGIATVVNAGTAAASYGNGVSLAGGGSLSNTGLVSGGRYGAVIDGTGNVDNTGTIEATGAVSNGVRLNTGGSISNTGAAALIEGGTAIKVYGGAGTVTNDASIVGLASYGSGIYLAAGGNVANQLGGVISGQSLGLFVGSATGTVLNFGTISASNAAGTGIWLRGGGNVNNAQTGSTSGYIQGYDALVIGSNAGGIGTVVNTGSIAGYNLGVWLDAGGSLLNYAAITASGTSGDGVVLGSYGGLGTVFNTGTILGTHLGVWLAAGGAMTNDGTIAGTTGDGVLLGSDGTVSNSGTIVGLGSSGVHLAGGGSVSNSAVISGGQFGVVLVNAGGTVLNGPSGAGAAAIDGGIYGVFIRDGAGTVVNYGSITGSSGIGVVLYSGGAVANASAAVITGGNRGVEIAGAAGAFSNAGTVTSGNLGVYLAAGGSVFNAQAGTITGGDGVRFTNGAGTLTNFGKITGVTALSGVGAELQGGRIINGAPTVTAAAIVGARGLEVYGAAGTVINFGTIAAGYINASAIRLHVGGSIANQQSGLVQSAGDGITIGGGGIGAGTVTNSGTIVGAGDAGIVLGGGGTIVNGPAGATAALIEGGISGVVTTYLPATIVNYGTIADAGYAGVFMAAGGDISNSRLVTGYQYGVLVRSAAGTVANSGTITATGTGGTGVELAAGGAVDNSGTIAGGRNGIFFNNAAAQIANRATGLIAGGVAGIYAATTGGYVNNGGTVVGGAIGVRLAGSSTLVNTGTVSGNLLSVYFIGGGNRLAIAPTATFIGNVDAQLGTGDVLELTGGTGTLGGFGTSFIGFEQIAVDLGAVWQLTGPVTLGSGFIVTDAGALDFGGPLTNDGSLNIEANAVLSFTGTVGGTGSIDFGGANGTLVIGVPSAMSDSITGFAPTDRIDLVGIGLAASYSYSGGVLRLFNGGGSQIAQLALTTTVTNPHFTLSTDGGAGTGTLLAVSAPTGTFTGTYLNGIVLNDPTAQNPALITSTAYVTNQSAGHNGDAVYGTTAAAWDLTNYGIITTASTAANAVGVRFEAGGTITNLGLIAGSINGIVIDGGAGVVANGGVIVATDVGTGAGIALHGGGNVLNGSGHSISGYNNGVFVSGGIGAVSNAGTIVSNGPGGAAIYLTQGGAVSNLGGLISASRNAVAIKGGVGFIANYGTIQNTSVLSAATYLGAGGNIINGSNGLIFSSHRNAVVVSGGAGSIVNYGTILDTATFAQVGTIQTGRYGAIALNAGGYVANGVGALIAGHTGIAFNNVAGTVFNAGTISQNDPVRYGSGVLMYGGGLVRNGYIGESGGPALITAYNTGVQIGPSSQGLGTGGPGTVVNYGTIAHIGPGTGGSAIYFGSGGIIVNYGLISGSRAGSGTGGYPGAVQARNQTAVIINLGTIANPNNSNGVNLLQGGVLINGANGYNAALIEAAHTAVYIGGTLGVPTPGATGTVLNYGTIGNSTTQGPAIALASGGNIVNYGRISSYRAAVSLGGSGSTNASAIVTNFGVISGATGISIGSGDTGNNTIVNFGTIAGSNGFAIRLGSGNDEIVIEASSQLNGAVGSFDSGDAFDLPFVAFGSSTVSLDSGNVLDISQNGVLVYTIQLDPNQDFTTGQFAAANDGSGGTLVVFGPDTTSPTTQTRVLAVDANSGATPIGIAAPADPDDAPAALTVQVSGLPSDGTVVLSDGVTPVSAGQALTVAQLTALQFIPTPGLIGQSSTFTYSVSDPAGNTASDAAFLGINLPPPPNSPSLINGLGGPEGFGENVLPRNDDGSSAAINITSVFSSGLNFFGTDYSQLYINNNGNITFNSSLRTFTPGPITAGFGNPIIAAFWADVDTRGGPGVPTGGNATGSNLVYWDLDTANHVFTVTWDDVGYFGSHTDKLDAFQLRLIDEGGGNFDIEFRYQAIYWTTGDASGGAGGLGGTVARAGFSAGDGLNSFELPQSGDQNAMLGLPSNPAPIGTEGATGETGVYRLQVRNGHPVPPVPTGLALSPASDSGKAGDNRTNDTTPTVTGAGGINGDTITLLANGTVVGSGTVANGNWAITTSALPDGLFSLTATQTDAAGNVSLSSQPLFVTVDTSLPVTTPISRTVLPNSGPAVIGIALPTDPDDNFSDPSQAPTIVVGNLPTNGTVTLGGATPVGAGQQLTTSQLAGLDFTPTGQTGTTSSFTYSVTDLAGNASTGTATFTIAATPPPPPPLTVQKFDFLFTYNDGKDYYIGTVVGGGNFSYQVGQIVPTIAGQYQIFAVEPTPPTEAPGTVSVSIYSHGGVGQASTTPIKTSQGQSDGSGGLTSETDDILGLDGAPHAFSGLVEASFQAIPLWGFVYTYADGRAFYSGTVASQSPLSDRTVTDAAGNLIGSYSVFRQGETTRPGGTVVVDRFTLNGLAFAPLRTGPSSVDGQGGLGSEQGLIKVNGASFAFSDRVEPPVTVTQPTLPLTTPPNPNDVFAAEVNELYREILGRNPDPAGLATYTTALANGASVVSIRTLLAQSSEAQAALNQLYHQIFGRNIDAGGAATYTNALINGLSLASVQLVLAQSGEAQAAIQNIYQQVLNRPADGGGLTAYMAAIGNPTAPVSLSDVRSTVAHSPEAATKLAQLVTDTLHRSTFAAELVGMENEISTDGVTQQTLQSELVTRTTAGTYTLVSDQAGSNPLTAQAGIPTLFDFSDVTKLASEGIVGFDPTRDTIQLSSSTAANFQIVQSDMQPNTTVNGTLIHFNSSQEIAVANVAPGSLTATNFRFV